MVDWREMGLQDHLEEVNDSMREQGNSGENILGGMRE